MSFELLVIVDNSSSSDSLIREHGLAILIQAGDQRVLFDTGSSADVLCHNAKSLNVDLSALTAVVLSHGHYDHTGGLGAVVSARPGVDIYANPQAFTRRWRDRPGESLKDISCPHSLDRLCEGGAVFHAVNAPEVVADWLVLSGPIGGPHASRQAFVARKGDELVVDTFEDELFGLLKGSGGWVVLTGCCHRGLRNTLRAAKFMAHGERIAAVVGGLHLVEADDADLDETTQLLRAFDEPDLYVCHCTGEQATQKLSQRLGPKLHAIGAGAHLTF